MHGLLSFPLTAFSADLETIAVDAFREHIEDQLQWRPSALFVACGTGEFSALSLQEYAAVEPAAGRVPVHAGAGGGPQIARAFAERRLPPARTACCCCR